MAIHPLCLIFAPFITPSEITTLKFHPAINQYITKCLEKRISLVFSPKYEKPLKVDQNHQNDSNLSLMQYGQDIIDINELIPVTVEDLASVLMLHYDLLPTKIRQIVENVSDVEQNLSNYNISTYITLLELLLAAFTPEKKSHNAESTAISIILAFSIAVLPLFWITSYGNDITITSMDHIPAILSILIPKSRAFVTLSEPERDLGLILTFFGDFFFFSLDLYTQFTLKNDPALFPTSLSSQKHSIIRELTLFAVNRHHLAANDLFCSLLLPFRHVLSILAMNYVLSEIHEENYITINAVIHGYCAKKNEKYRKNDKIISLNPENFEEIINTDKKQELYSENLTDTQSVTNLVKSCEKIEKIQKSLNLLALSACLVFISSSIHVKIYHTANLEQIVTKKGEEMCLLSENDENVLKNPHIFSSTVELTSKLPNLPEDDKKIDKSDHQPHNSLSFDLGNNTSDNLSFISQKSSASSKQVIFDQFSAKSSKHSEKTLDVCENDMGSSFELECVNHLNAFGFELFLNLITTILYSFPTIPHVLLPFCTSNQEKSENDIYFEFFNIYTAAISSIHNISIFYRYNDISIPYKLAVSLRQCGVSILNFVPTIVVPAVENEDDKKNNLSKNGNNCDNINNDENDTILQKDLDDNRIGHIESFSPQTFQRKSSITTQNSDKSDRLFDHEEDLSIISSLSNLHQSTPSFLLLAAETRHKQSFSSSNDKNNEKSEKCLQNQALFGNNTENNRYNINTIDHDHIYTRKISIPNEESAKAFDLALKRLATSNREYFLTIFMTIIDNILIFFQHNDVIYDFSMIDHHISPKSPSIIKKREKYNNFVRILPIFSHLLDCFTTMIIHYRANNNIPVLTYPYEQNSDHHFTFQHPQTRPFVSCLEGTNIRSTDDSDYDDNHEVPLDNQQLPSKANEKAVNILTNDRNNSNNGPCGHVYTVIDKIIEWIQHPAVTLQLTQLPLSLEITKSSVFGSISPLISDPDVDYFDVNNEKSDYEEKMVENSLNINDNTTIMNNDVFVHGTTLLFPSTYNEIIKKLTRTSLIVYNNNVVVSTSFENEPQFVTPTNNKALLQLFTITLLRCALLRLDDIHKTDNMNTSGDETFEQHYDSTNITENSLKMDDNVHEDYKRLKNGKKSANNSMNDISSQQLPPLTTPHKHHNITSSNSNEFIPLQTPMIEIYKDIQKSGEISTISLLDEENDYNKNTENIVIREECILYQALKSTIFDPKIMKNSSNYLQNGENYEISPFSHPYITITSSFNLQSYLYPSKTQKEISPNLNAPDLTKKSELNTQNNCQIDILLQNENITLVHIWLNTVLGVHSLQKSDININNNNNNVNIFNQKSSKLCENELENNDKTFITTKPNKLLTIDSLTHPLNAINEDTNPTPQKMNKIIKPAPKQQIVKNQILLKFIQQLVNFKLPNDLSKDIPIIETASLLSLLLPTLYTHVIQFTGAEWMQCERITPTNEIKKQKIAKNGNSVGELFDKCDVLYTFSLVTLIIDKISTLLIHNNTQLVVELYKHGIEKASIPIISFNSVLLQYLLIEFIHLLSNLLGMVYGPLFLSYYHKNVTNGKSDEYSLKNVFIPSELSEIYTKLHTYIPFHEISGNTQSKTSQSALSLGGLALYPLHFSPFSSTNPKNFYKNHKKQEFTIILMVLKQFCAIFFTNIKRLFVLNTIIHTLTSTAFNGTKSDKNEFNNGHSLDFLSQYYCPSLYDPDSFSSLFTIFSPKYSEDVKKTLFSACFGLINTKSIKSIEISNQDVVDPYVLPTPTPSLLLDLNWLTTTFHFFIGPITVCTARIFPILSQFSTNYPKITESNENNEEIGEFTQNCTELMVFCTNLLRRVFFTIIIMQVTAYFTPITHPNQVPTPTALLQYYNNRENLKNNGKLQNCKNINNITVFDRYWCYISEMLQILTLITPPLSFDRCTNLHTPQSTQNITQNLSNSHNQHPILSIQGELSSILTSLGISTTQSAQKDPESIQLTQIITKIGISYDIPLLFEENGVKIKFLPLFCNKNHILLLVLALIGNNPLRPGTKIGEIWGLPTVASHCGEVFIPTGQKNGKFALFYAQNDENSDNSMKNCHLNVEYVPNSILLPKNLNETNEKNLPFLPNFIHINNFTIYASTVLSSPYYTPRTYVITPNDLLEVNEKGQNSQKSIKLSKKSSELSEKDVYYFTPEGFINGESDNYANAVKKNILSVLITKIMKNGTFCEKSLENWDLSYTKRKGSSKDERSYYKTLRKDAKTCSLTELLYILVVIYLESMRLRAIAVLNQQNTAKTMLKADKNTEREFLIETRDFSIQWLQAQACNAQIDYAVDLNLRKMSISHVLTKNEVQSHFSAIVQYYSPQKIFSSFFLTKKHGKFHKNPVYLNRSLRIEDCFDTELLSQFQYITKKPKKVNEKSEIINKTHPYANLTIELSTPPYADINMMEDILSLNDLFLPTQNSRSPAKNELSIEESPNRTPFFLYQCTQYLPTLSHIAPLLGNHMIYSDNTTLYSHHKKMLQKFPSRNIAPYYQNDGNVPLSDMLPLYSNHISTFSRVFDVVTNHFTLLSFSQLSIIPTSHTKIVLEHVYMRIWVLLLSKYERIRYKAFQFVSFFTALFPNVQLSSLNSVFPWVLYVFDAISTAYSANNTTLSILNTPSQVLLPISILSPLLPATFSSISMQIIAKRNKTSETGNIIAQLPQQQLLFGRIMQLLRFFVLKTVSYVYSHGNKHDIVVLTSLLSSTPSGSVFNSHHNIDKIQTRHHKDENYIHFNYDSRESAQSVTTTTSTKSYYHLLQPQPSSLHNNTTSKQALLTIINSIAGNTIILPRFSQNTAQATLSALHTSSPPSSLFHNPVTFYYYHSLMDHMGDFIDILGENGSENGHNTAERCDYVGWALAFPFVDNTCLMPFLHCTERDITLALPQVTQHLDLLHSNNNEKNLGKIVENDVIYPLEYYNSGQNNKNMLNIGQKDAEVSKYGDSSHNIHHSITDSLPLHLHHLFPLSHHAKRKYVDQTTFIPSPPHHFRQFTSTLFCPKLSFLGGLHENELIYHRMLHSVRNPYGNHVVLAQKRDALKKLPRVDKNGVNFVNLVQLSTISTESLVTNGVKQQVLYDIDGYIQQFIALFTQKSFYDEKISENTDKYQKINENREFSDNIAYNKSLNGNTGMIFTPRPATSSEIEINIEIIDHMPKVAENRENGDELFKTPVYYSEKRPIISDPRHQFPNTTPTPQTIAQFLSTTTRFPYYNPQQLSQTPQNIPKYTFSLPQMRNIASTHLFLSIYGQLSIILMKILKKQHKLAVLSIIVLLRQNEIEIALKRLQKIQNNDIGPAAELERIDIAEKIEKIKNTKEHKSIYCLTPVPLANSLQPPIVTHNSHINNHSTFSSTEIIDNKSSIKIKKITSLADFLSNPPVFNDYPYQFWDLSRITTEIVEKYKKLQILLSEAHKGLFTILALLLHDLTHFDDFYSSGAIVDEDGREIEGFSHISDIYQYFAQTHRKIGENNHIPQRLRYSSQIYHEVDTIISQNNDNDIPDETSQKFIFSPLLRLALLSNILTLPISLIHSTSTAHATLFCYEWLLSSHNAKTSLWAVNTNKSGEFSQNNEKLNKISIQQGELISLLLNGLKTWFIETIIKKIGLFSQEFPKLLTKYVENYQKDDESAQILRDTGSKSSVLSEILTMVEQNEVYSDVLLNNAPRDSISISKTMVSELQGGKKAVKIADLQRQRKKREKELENEVISTTTTVSADIAQISPESITSYVDLVDYIAFSIETTSLSLVLTSMLPTLLTVYHRQPATVSPSIIKEWLSLCPSPFLPAVHTLFFTFFAQHQFTHFAPTATTLSAYSLWLPQNITGLRHSTQNNVKFTEKRDNSEKNPEKHEKTPRLVNMGSYDSSKSLDIKKSYKSSNNTTQTQQSYHHCDFLGEVLSTCLLSIEAIRSDECSLPTRLLLISLCMQYIYQRSVIILRHSLAIQMGLVQSLMVTSSPKHAEVTELHHFSRENGRIEHIIQQNNHNLSELLLESGENCNNSHDICLLLDASFPLPSQKYSYPAETINSDGNWGRVEKGKIKKRLSTVALSRQSHSTAALYHRNSVLSSQSITPQVLSSQSSPITTPLPLPLMEKSLHKTRNSVSSPRRSVFSSHHVASPTSTDTVTSTPLPLSGNIPRKSSISSPIPLSQVRKASILQTTHHTQQTGKDDIWHDYQYSTTSTAQVGLHSFFLHELRLKVLLMLFSTCAMVPQVKTNHHEDIISPMYRDLLDYFNNNNNNNNSIQNTSSSEKLRQNSTSSLSLSHLRHKKHFYQRYEGYRLPLPPSLLTLTLRPLSQTPLSLTNNNKQLSTAITVYDTYQLTSTLSLGQYRSEYYVNLSSSTSVVGAVQQQCIALCDQLQWIEPQLDVVMLELYRLTMLQRETNVIQYYYKQKALYHYDIIKKHAPNYQSTAEKSPLFTQISNFYFFHADAPHLAKYAIRNDNAIYALPGLDTTIFNIPECAGDLLGQLYKATHSGNILSSLLCNLIKSPIKSKDGIKFDTTQNWQLYVPITNTMSMHTLREQILLFFASFLDECALWHDPITTISHCVDGNPLTITDLFTSSTTPTTSFGGRVVGSLMDDQPTTIISQHQPNNNFFSCLSFFTKINVVRSANANRLVTPALSVHPYSLHIALGENYGNPGQSNDVPIVVNNSFRLCDIAPISLYLWDLSSNLQSGSTFFQETISDSHYNGNQEQIGKIENIRPKTTDNQFEQRLLQSSLSLYYISSLHHTGNSITSLTQPKVGSRLDEFVNTSANNYMKLRNTRDLSSLHSENILITPYKSLIHSQTHSANRSVWSLSTWLSRLVMLIHINPALLITILTRFSHLCQDDTHFLQNNPKYLKSHNLLSNSHNPPTILFPYISQLVQAVPNIFISGGWINEILQTIFPIKMMQTVIINSGTYCVPEVVNFFFPHLLRENYYKKQNKPRNSSGFNEILEEHQKLQISFITQLPLSYQLLFYLQYHVLHTTVSTTSITTAITTNSITTSTQTPLTIAQSLLLQTTPYNQHYPLMLFSVASLYHRHGVSVWGYIPQFLLNCRFDVYNVLAQFLLRGALANTKASCIIADSCEAEIAATIDTSQQQHNEKKSVGHSKECFHIKTLPNGDIDIEWDENYCYEDTTPKTAQITKDSNQIDELFFGSLEKTQKSLENNEKNDYSDSVDEKRVILKTNVTSHQSIEPVQTVIDEPQEDPFSCLTPDGRFRVIHVDNNSNLISHHRHSSFGRSSSHITKSTVITVPPAIVISVLRYATDKATQTLQSSYHTHESLLHPTNNAAQKATTSLTSTLSAFPSLTTNPHYITRLQFILFACISHLSQTQCEMYLNQRCWLREITTLSDKLFACPKPHRRVALQRALEKIKLRPYIYLPTIPDARVVRIEPANGRTLQSAAKVPILVPFVVEPFLTSGVNEDQDENNTLEYLWNDSRNNLEASANTDITHNCDTVDSEEEDEFYANNSENVSDGENILSSSTPLAQPLPSSSQNYVSTALIFKSRDDIRQDALSLQIMNLTQQIIKLQLLEAKLTIYNVLPNSIDNVPGGVIECIPNARSRDEIGKSMPCSLKTYFLSIFGQSTSSYQYQSAQRAFLLSCAGYAVTSYILQVRDRHNGNIMINWLHGNLIHIDFGFIFDISPGGDMNFERVAFKLTSEMLELMLDTSYNNENDVGAIMENNNNIIRNTNTKSNVKNTVSASAIKKTEKQYKKSLQYVYTSPLYIWFVQNVVKIFLSVRKYILTELMVLTIPMFSSTLPCFKGKKDNWSSDSLLRLYERLFPHDNDTIAAAKMYQLVQQANNHWRTNMYDWIQLKQQHIYYFQGHSGSDQHAQQQQFNDIGQ